MMVLYDRSTSILVQRDAFSAAVYKEYTGTALPKKFLLSY